MPSAAAGEMPALPPGFRFHPTDEELIVHYLSRQSAAMPSPVPIIAEVNIYKCDPWELPDKALFGENEWYFFSPRDRKYPNGARPNRAAGSGYWKATGTDKAILATPTSEHIGVKKALVFYRGKPPRGSKTDWIMHEYRLTAGIAAAARRRGSSMRLDDWVLCRIHKKGGSSLQQQQEMEEGSTVEDSHNNTAVSSSPPPKSEAFDDGDDEQQQLRPMAIAKSCSITDLLNTVDYAALSQLLLDGGGPSSDQLPPPPESPLVYAPPAPWQTLNYHDIYSHQIPHLSDAHIDEHDYYANDSNSYAGGMKRKRDLEAAAAGDHPRNSSYCNKQLTVGETSSFQYGGGMVIHPFTNQHHLQM